VWGRLASNRELLPDKSQRPRLRLVVSLCCMCELPVMVLAGSTCFPATTPGRMAAAALKLGLRAGIVCLDEATTLFQIDSATVGSVPGSNWLI